MKILVVDDEQDITSLFQQRFRREIREGLFEFSFKYSGEEALEFLKEHNHEAILILSDINMPGMSGLELLRRIRLNDPTPPPVIMMITAYGDKENYDQAMSLGADDFLITLL
jgi:two-component system, chemotaxis family, chemotaxis protein CheY